MLVPPHTSKLCIIFKNDYSHTALSTKLPSFPSSLFTFETSPLHNNWTAKSVETVLMERWINFECFDVSHYQYVQRRSGERDYSGCLNPSVKHGGGTVIVWGYISVCGVVDLLKTHEIMNSDQNLTLLFYLESIWLAADLFFSMTMITNTPSMQ